MERLESLSKAGRQMTNNSEPNPFEFSEADTCREFVTPAIQAAGWGDAPFEIAEQRSFTDGRIVLAGRSAKRREGKRSDYLLRYRLVVLRLDPTNRDRALNRSHQRFPANSSLTDSARLSPCAAATSPPKKPPSSANGATSASATRSRFPKERRAHAAGAGAAARGG